MSIIFQLFNAEDLKKLTSNDLEQLKNIVRDRVVNGPFPDAVLKASLGNSDNLESELQASPPPDYGRQVINTLRRRASDIFRQLMERDPSNQPDSFVDAASIFDQLLSQKDFSDLNNQLPVTGRKILLWAIVCELANLKSYIAMEDIQRQARTEISPPKVYQGEEEQRLKDPDSAYSPFNPLSPVQYRNRS
jgi:hypothetical protein